MVNANTFRLDFVSELRLSTGWLWYYISEEASGWPNFWIWPNLIDSLRLVFNMVASCTGKDGISCLQSVSVSQWCTLKGLWRKNISAKSKKASKGRLRADDWLRDDAQISISENTIDLGVFVTTDFKRSLTVKLAVFRARARLFQILRGFVVMTKEAFRSLYLSLVRSILGNSIQIVSPHLQKDIDLTERLQ